MKLQIHPLPYAADIALAIRDDDVSYFTPPEKLEKIYKNAWDKGFKVSFATIPKHKGVRKLNVPPEFRDTNNYYPIYENTELIKYLKPKISEGKVDIMQHGFCHSDDFNLLTPKFDLEKGIITNSDNQKMNLVQTSEFYGLKEEEVNFRVSEGKSILEKSFGVPIKVFVAPQGLLTKSLWMALWKNNLNYCGGIGRKIITQVPINHINFGPLLKMATKKVLRINQESLAEDVAHITDNTTIPATYSHYWNKFTDDESAEYWFNHFKALFGIRKQEKGYFILLTHYWEYFYDWEEKITQKRQHEYLNKILNYIDSNSNVWKCTVSELADWIEAKRTIIIKQKQDKLKISSSIDIGGFTIGSEGINIEKLDKENIKTKKKGSKEFLILDIKAGETIVLPMK